MFFGAIGFGGGGGSSRITKGVGVAGD